MRLLVASLVLLVAGSGTAAPAGAQQPELVRLAQQVSVSSLDSTLPAVSFADWLADAGRLPGSAIRWEINDCGEGGDGRAAPTCVEALVWRQGPPSPPSRRFRSG